MSPMANQGKTAVCGSSIFAGCLGGGGGGGGGASLVATQYRILTETNPGVVGGFGIISSSRTVPLDDRAHQQVT